MNELAPCAVWYAALLECEAARGSLGPILRNCNARPDGSPPWVRENCAPVCFQTSLVKSLLSPVLEIIFKEIVTKRNWSLASFRALPPTEK